MLMIIRARQVCQKELLPLLEMAAGLSVKVHTTTGPGHATTLVQSLDLSTVDVLAVVGGDGTMFEMLQVRRAKGML